MTTDTLNPAQLKAQTKFNNEVEALTAAANQRIGAQIAVESDFSTYKEPDWTSQSLSSRAAEVLKAVVRTGFDAAYKPELLKRLQTVRFTFDGSATPALENMKLSEGVLSFSMHKTHNNLADVTFKLLQNALNG